jgi:hypothetical protein
LCRSLTECNVREHSLNLDIEAGLGGFDDYEVHEHNIFVNSLSGMDLDTEEVRYEDRSDSPVAQSGQSEADSSGDVDNGISEYDYFTEVRKSVMMWAGRWGGHTNWRHALDEGYVEAMKSGQVSAWVYEVSAHANQGRRHLSMMQNIDCVLPKEMWKIRELWRQKAELLEIVLRGINSIELRVDIVEQGMFTVFTP